MKKFMRCAVWVATLTLLFGAAAANATTVTIGGGMGDWGIANPNVGLNSLVPEAYNVAVTGTFGDIKYWEESGVGPSGVVTPGSGGTPFDIRGLYFTQDTQYFYFGAIVGIGPSGITSTDGRTYYISDIALSFDGSTSGPKNGYEYGIKTLGTNNGKIYSVDGWNWNSPSGMVPHYSESSPAYLTSSTPALGGGSSDFYYGTDSNIYYIEARVLQSLFPSTNGISFHLTESCGNDVGTLNVPVPEPGMMMLLGSGLIGLAGWGRKKFRK